MLLNMKELLAVANEHYFAVPAFNVGTNIMLRVVLECCEEKNAPVILAIHPLELAFQGESFLAQCVAAAHQARVAVTIHLDHGSQIEHIYHAIRLGFTSVMIDASYESFEKNVSICKKVVEVAHPLGVSVEGELGTVGSVGNDAEGGAEEIAYTKPSDAVRFVRETGVDTLAIAIGTAHGIYPKGLKPELKLDLLKEIKSKVSVPLVLHGGSANSDEEISESVRLGINKINISSDTKDAFYQRLRLDLAADPNVREPFEVYVGSVQAMRKVVFQKLELFGDVNRMKHYRL